MENEMQERLEICKDKISELETKLKKDMKRMNRLIESEHDLFNLEFLRSTSLRVHDMCVDLEHWYLMLDTLEHITDEVDDNENQQ
ncbi:MAG TPA: hypothetical protein DCR08_03065 [Lactobacillus sp.]|uniref:hypothetical protein n=1 Tax=Ligilactobacillus murinus TaxID=1622 RepID=UPI00096F6428|nr:hypothetical protein [Ligilactobacillus murinus]ASD50597.1 hypothetical protein [Lactobacillus phage phiEF-1.1]HAP22933.1 hypothetical protein [Lactobacillus sp.]